jgi:hypothetical protein
MKSWRLLPSVVMSCGLMWGLFPHFTLAADAPRPIQFLVITPPWLHIKFSAVYTPDIALELHDGKGPCSRLDPNGLAIPKSVVVPIELKVAEDRGPRGVASQGQIASTPPRLQDAPLDDPCQWTLSEVRYSPADNAPQEYRLFQFKPDDDTGDFRDGFDMWCIRVPANYNATHASANLPPVICDYHKGLTDAQRLEYAVKDGPRLFEFWRPLTLHLASEPTLYVYFRDPASDSPAPPLLSPFNSFKHQQR